MKIGIVNYGAGNFASVRNAIEHLKLPWCEVREPDALKRVTHIILPGVGTFPAAMRRLNALGLIDALGEEVLTARKPYLGICVGMQVLATTGHEFEVCRGLDWIKGQVREVDAIANGLRLPHIGWNRVEEVGGDTLFKGIAEPTFYFVHSFKFSPDDPNSVSAWCDYGERFAAAVQHNNIYGVQFHPEKSQGDGLRLLLNFSRV